MVGQSIEIMKKQFDVVNGGFRDAPKFFEPEAIQLALAHGFLENETGIDQDGIGSPWKNKCLYLIQFGGAFTAMLNNRIGANRTLKKC